MGGHLDVHSGGINTAGLVSGGIGLVCEGTGLVSEGIWGTVGPYNTDAQWGFEICTSIPGKDVRHRGGSSPVVSV